jgi:tRNA1(Val) A37 N6-methylase TrmN6
MTVAPRRRREGIAVPGAASGLPDSAALGDDSGFAVTEDGFLDHRLRIRQPRDGYRAAIDPVFLAAAVPARSNERALDIGAGVGVAALALATRVAGLRVTGIEIDPALMRLCATNAKANGLERRTDFMVGDVARPPVRLVPGSFDHVMANPPYLEAARNDVSPVPGRAAANVEGRAAARGNVEGRDSVAARAGARDDLVAWVRLALVMVREGGTVTIIHRADRLDDVIACLKGRTGGTIIFPLWPDRGAAPAKRVLIQGIKGSGAALRMARGLVLHEEDGRFTQEADAVLRDGGGLVL